MNLSSEHFLLARALAGGSEMSGAALATHFHVSRTTISNWVATLAESGLELESNVGRGYRLLSPVEFYDPVVLSDVVQGKSMLDRLQVLETVNSTNDAARELLSEADRVAVIADYQLVGRGRRGRGWISPPGLNIYLTVGWRFSAGIAILEGLSLAIGAAVAEALDQIGLPGVAVKWPNDLLLRGGKLGGILIEVEGDMQGPCTVLVGIGINRYLPESLRQTIDQPTTDMWCAMQSETPSRAEVVLALIDSVTDVLGGYPETGFGHWRDRWLLRDGLRGEQVLISGGHSVIEGVESGVTQTGALMVHTDKGMVEVYGGEVSVRRK